MCLVDHNRTGMDHGIFSLRNSVRNLDVKKTDLQVTWRPRAHLELLIQQGNQHINWIILSTYKVSTIVPHALPMRGMQDI